MYGSPSHGLHLGESLPLDRIRSLHLASDSRWRWEVGSAVWVGENDWRRGGV